MRHLKYILYIIVIPILYFATYWNIRKRIITNLYLTMSKLGYQSYVDNIKIITFENITRTIMDKMSLLLLLLPFWLLKRIIIKYTPIDNIHKLRQSLKNNRGAIVYSCHIGPYFLIPAALALKGYKVITIENIGPFEGYFVGRQVRKLNKSVSTDGVDRLTIYPIYDETLLRKLKKHLNEGNLVFMMGDYRSLYSRKPMYIDFLGYDIIPGRGIAWLYKQTNAPIFPIIPQNYKKSEPGYTVRDELKLDKKLSIGHITQEIYRILEKIILKSPKDWVLWIDYHLMLAPHVINESKGNSATPVTANNIDVL